MRFLMVCLMGLMLSVQANTAQQSTVSGRVRFADGQPVTKAQVTLFDLADLHQGVVARATTDEFGYFELSLASLGGPALPQMFALGHNYPNPFNPSTVIPYQLPVAGHVRLDVFNVLGQHVATLVDAQRQAGFHTAKWDATDAAGQAVAAGVYLYRLTAGGQQQIQRMVLIDGQAGIAAGASSAAAAMSTDAAEREYGLVVSGEGLTTYTDVAFGVRAGMAAVELVVEETPLTMSSGKPVVGVSRLTDHEASDSAPSWSPSGDRIAFQSNRNGNFDIYVMDLDGGDEPRQLTDDPAHDRSPSWSPSGDRIAFESDRNGNFDIYVMDLDGSDEPRQLTDDPAHDRSPSWSPDGQQIAFESNRNGNFDIYVMNRDWGTTHQLTDDPAHDSAPSWSPSGDRIAFVSDRDGKRGIYVMDLDGGNPRRLTDHSASDSAPSWSPSGDQIAFEASIGTNDAIFVVDKEGSNLRRLTSHEARDVSPSWSPSGDQVAFASNRDGDNFGIYVMDAGGPDMTGTDGDGGTDDNEGTDDDGGTDDGAADGDGGTGDDEGTDDDGGTDDGAADGDGAVSLLPGGGSMEFVWIEPGVFQMGSDTGRKDESPVHEVEISRGFWLGKYEVTQEQWKSVMDEEPWSGRARVESNPSHPAVIISWDEVQEFIRRINEDAGEELYRLPTEAEWEYACRAGTQTRWSFGDDESLLPDYAWYHGNNYFTKGAKTVGTKRPNPWGLYDMHGNVWEWVQDWYDEEYYSRSVRNDPQGPTSGLGRVIRGGHFGHIDGVRSAYRHLRFPDSRSYTVGVRLLRIAGD